jgi:hypothetical protein
LAHCADGSNNTQDSRLQHLRNKKPLYFGLISLLPASALVHYTYHVAYDSSFRPRTCHNAAGLMNLAGACQNTPKQSVAHASDARFQYQQQTWLATTDSHFQPAVAASH